MQFAVSAALAAGKEILKIYHTDFSTSYKSDGSPLTLADENANRVILEILEPLKIPCISEENKDVPYEIRKEWKRCWMIDPLDGTKEFVKKNDEFTVNIALIEEGQASLGVVYVPVLKQLYVGSENQAYLYEGIEDLSDYTPSRVQKLAPKKEHSSLVFAVSRSHLSQETESYMAQAIEKLSPKKQNVLPQAAHSKFVGLLRAKQIASHDWRPRWNGIPLRDTPFVLP